MGGSDSDSSLDDYGQPRVRAAAAVAANPTTEPLAAPAAITNNASLSNQLSPTEWSVPSGHLEGFLFANAPTQISRYNFAQIRSKHRKELATRAGGKFLAYGDVFQLTEAGEATRGYSPGTPCATIWLACTGAALNGKEGPNCVRLCCGGIGCRAVDCQLGSERPTRSTTAAFV
jgi:hypothetical protein